MEKNLLAKVNDHMIYKEELEKFILAYKEQTKRDEVTEEEKEYLLDRIAQNYLLIDSAKEKGINVDDTILEQQMQKYIEGFQSEEKFYAVLKEKGVELEEFKNGLRNDILMQLAVNQEVEKNLNVTDEDIENYYTENNNKMITKPSVKASHILFSTKSGEKKAKLKAEKVLDKLQKGHDFGELAKENSDCPSKEKGGDLGFFTRGQMLPAFEHMAFNLSIGQISDLVETQFGYHIIKKDAENEAITLTLEQAKPHIYQLLVQEQSKIIVTGYIKELKENTEVKYY